MSEGQSVPQSWKRVGDRVAGTKSVTPGQHPGPTGIHDHELRETRDMGVCFVQSDGETRPSPELRASRGRTTKYDERDKGDDDTHLRSDSGG